MTTPQNKQKQQLAAKQGELRNLKLEESTLLKLSALVNDQITRLKIEEMALSGCITSKNIRDVTQAPARAEGPTIAALNPYELAQQRKAMQIESQSSASSTHATASFQDQFLEPGGDLVTLDLDVPNASGFQEMYDDDETSDDDEDEECMLSFSSK